MNNSLREFLFTKHILVGRKGEHQVEVLYALLNKLNIKVTAGYELASDDLVRFCDEQMGHYIPEPFYRGFPRSVLELTPEARLLDQLVHYTKTYGFGHFEEAGHSVFEDAVKRRSAFSETDAPKEFRILSEEDAVNELLSFCGDMCKSSRPLNPEMLNVVALASTEYRWVPETVNSKMTAVQLLYCTKAMWYARFINVTDFVKLVDYINFTVYGKEKMNKLNLKNQDRKFITRVLDALLVKPVSYLTLQEVMEKRDVWCGILHHIHYAPKNNVAVGFCASIRNENVKSAYSLVELEMKVKDFVGAAEILKERKGNGALLRNLNWLVSGANAIDTKHILDMVEAKNPLVLLQMQNMYKHYSADPRTFKFTRHERIRTHRETERNHTLTNARVSQISALLEEKLKAALAGKVGKVYIAPGMENIAVPMNISASESGFGILPTGSKVKLPEGKKVRAFTYWEKVNDIDLSCFGVDEDGSRTEFSWRTMWGRQSDAVTYSGDETSGYNGGSEYFDIDIDKVREFYPSMKYMVFCNNVFSGKDFSECVCRAGWMSRDVIDSGEIYEPKTVKSAYTINAKSTYAYLFAIDLEDRSVVWLNLAETTRARVAGQTEFGWLEEYFTACDTMNMRKLFEYAGTVVSLDDAELVVGDVETDKPVIRSWEFEKAFAYLN